MANAVSDQIESARSQRAYSLDLSNQGLTDLPESIGQLSELRELFLAKNQLSSLPESLGQLSQLRALHVRRNRLTSIPDSIGELSALEEMSLGENQLSSLPESLGQLSQLRGLCVRHNRLTSLPKSIRQLSRLQSLDVEINQLRFLPELPPLQRLLVGQNRLTSLPESLGSSLQLEVLDAQDNQIASLPEWLGQLSRLELLDVQGNQLTHLPESLGRLVLLTSLFLRRNHLTSLPGSLACLPQLKTLQLEENPLDPELAAAYAQGLDALKSYLRPEAESQVVLNEAKLKVPATRRGSAVGAMSFPTVREQKLVRQHAEAPATRLRVFLCHASEDKAPVRELCSKLRSWNHDPWLDEDRILPGQDWEREIRSALQEAHVVLVCLSPRSEKRGFVQKELKRALDIAEEQPDGTIHLIPARLEPCMSRSS